MDQVIVVVYLMAVLGLGLWSGRKIRDIEQFAVAGRSFTSMVVFATLSASFIGGGFSIPFFALTSTFEKATDPKST